MTHIDSCFFLYNHFFSSLISVRRGSWFVCRLCEERVNSQSLIMLILWRSYSVRNGEILVTLWESSWEDNRKIGIWRILENPTGLPKHAQKNKRPRLTLVVSSPTKVSDLLNDFLMIDKQNCGVWWHSRFRWNRRMIVTHNYCIFNRPTTYLLIMLTLIFISSFLFLILLPLVHKVAKCTLESC